LTDAVDTKAYAVDLTGRTQTTGNFRNVKNLIQQNEILTDSYPKHIFLWQLEVSTAMVFAFRCYLKQFRDRLRNGITNAVISFRDSAGIGSFKYIMGITGDKMLRHLS
jgi:hypothetical protein